MDFQANHPNSRAIVRYSGSSAIKAVHSLDPTLASVAKSYFGIDLHRVPEMSDEEIGALADRVQAMDRLMEVLPILEKHFKTLIDGQVAYEQFIANVQKEVEKGAKSIDKNILDVWLLSKGYQNHIKLMGQKAYNGAAKLDADHAHAVAQELLDFNTALQIAAYRHQLKMKATQNKLPAMQEREQLAAAEREEKEYRKNLWQFGSKAKRQGKSGGSSGGGFWQGVWDFFSGK